MLHQHLQLLTADNLLQFNSSTFEPVAASSQDADEDVEEEVQGLGDSTTDDGIIMTFQRWMCLQVIHFAALDAISSFASQQTGDTRLFFVTV
jgi:hypothetical protein